MHSRLFSSASNFFCLSRASSWDLAPLIVGATLHGGDACGYSINPYMLPAGTISIEPGSLTGVCSNSSIGWPGYSCKKNASKCQC